ncbi:MAG: 50S ribosomal protein L33 [Cyanobacteria bacterium P01_H01_bin.74]
MKKKKKEATAVLACSSCMQRNYSTPKSLESKARRLVLKKYCNKCLSHTEHRETC